MLGRCLVSYTKRLLRIVVGPIGGEGHQPRAADKRQEASTAMKVGELGGQARGFTRSGWPRRGAVGFKMTIANADLKPAKYGPAVAMRTSRPKVISPDDLSFAAASQSERLDNSQGSRYGLELVIPMSSRRLETR